MPERPRLPLPGEKPVHIYRPDSGRRRPSWQRGRFGLFLSLWRLLPWALALVIGLIGLRVWQSTGLPVTVVVNGAPIDLLTHRRTVAGVVRAVGVRPDEAVYLAPPADTRLTAGMTVTLAARRPVVVHVDGETLVGSSHELDPRAIVEDLGVPLGDADWVRVDRATRPSAQDIAENPALVNVPVLPREISVVRPAHIIVEQSGRRVAFDTTARTLGQALDEAGFAIYEADQVDPPLDTPLDESLPPEGLVVRIYAAAPVTVRADGVTRVVRTHQDTVGGLLAELGLAAVEGDYTIPAPQAALQAGGAVQLVRVTEQVLEETRSIPFETVYVPDPTLELDQQRKVQEGESGVLTRRVRVRYEDGVAVSRAVEGEWVTRQPVASVVAYGTRIVLRELTTPEGTFYYWRHFKALATSYSPLNATDKSPGDPFYGLAATGAPVRQGVIAVDPEMVNLYTNLYVDGYGPGQALDIGGEIKGYRVDLGYTDEELILWHEWVDVYLLTPVPPPGEIIWMLPEG